MFTGIIQTTAPITRLTVHPGLLDLQCQLPAEIRASLETGASVAIDGICLTVCRITDNTVFFQAMAETLTRTTLGLLTENQPVHVERSARFGDEIGGHVLSGHIDTVAEIVRIEPSTNNYAITLKINPAWLKYIFPKGFIALSGASLTVVDVDRKEHSFSVHLIPETLTRTTFSQKKKGDKLNVEIDRQTQAIVDTTELFLQRLADKGGINPWNQ